MAGPHSAFTILEREGTPPCEYVSMSQSTITLAVRGAISRNGFSFGYAIEGEGPTLLIIGSHVFYPRTFSNQLRQKRRLVFLDHRGFAQTQRPLEARDCELETIVDDMAAICDVLDLGEVDVLGHSGHGYMALEFARRFPHRVGKAVLVGTGPDHSAPHMQAGARIWDALGAPERKARLEADLAVMEKRIRTDPERRFIWMCLGLGARSWFDPAYDATALWDGVNVNMPVFDRLWGQVFAAYPTREVVAELVLPLLICMGRHDHLVAPIETWLPLLPERNAPRLALFERSAHTPQMEEAELFDTALLDFLN